MHYNISLFITCNLGGKILLGDSVTNSDNI